ncbi:30S ribosomal protein S21 [bacterium Unc6]|nr:30S ribosomal protein S21 [bacterium Unc6]
MSRVDVGKEGSLERALRKLKKKVEREGLLRQVRIKRYYEKPSERKKRKAKDAREARRKNRYF